MKPHLAMIPIRTLGLIGFRCRSRAALGGVQRSGYGVVELLSITISNAGSTRTPCPVTGQ